MSLKTLNSKRRGAVLPLFAILLPVLLMLCGFAINVAYMQLTRTELKIATDAGARAGGRAWSATQDVDQAKQYAFLGAKANYVAGTRLRPFKADAKNEIEFGLATSAGGRYTFVKKNTNAVKNGTTAANSIRVVGRRDTGSRDGVVPLMIGGVGSTTTFEPVTTATCIQLDRDVSLVMDKSGSMAYPTNDRLCAEVLDELLTLNLITQNELDQALFGIEDPVVAGWHPNTQNAIIYSRNWSANVLNRVANTPGLLGTGVPDDLTDPPQTTRRYNNGFTAEQIGNVLNYGTDINVYNDGTGTGPAPRFSRWEILGDAVEAFLDVFENSPQEETASLITFSQPGITAVDVDLVGTADYQDILDELAAIRPTSGTGIGAGLQSGIAGLFGPTATANNPPPPLANHPANARKFAAKTIVVMTDGRETPSYTPQSADVITDIAANHNVVVHTVTFTPEADQGPMEDVAETGGGKHYHANTGPELVAIFREIANNLPTTMID